MLPMDGARRGRSSLIPQYLRRMVQPRQMDFQAAMYLMFHFAVDPKKAYRSLGYHKHATDQWARTDPAFFVIMVGFLSVASVAFGIAFHGSVLAVLRLLLWSVFIDFIGVGVVIATICWFVTNQFLREPGVHRSDTARVEWAYALDVHCNSFFPFFLLTYVVQYLMLYVLLGENFVSVLLSNFLYACAFAFYNYVTFLGYEELSIVKNTTVLLIPTGVLAAVLLVLSLFGVNATRAVLSFYFGTAGEAAASLAAGSL